MVYRGLVFGMGLAWGIVAAVFLLDLFVGRRAWCGRLCPVGAFYGMLGEAAVLRVSAVRREQCDDCMDCFAICPEHQVIKPALKRGGQGYRSGDHLRSLYQLWALHRCLWSRRLCVFHTIFKQLPPGCIRRKPKSEVSS